MKKLITLTAILLLSSSLFQAHYAAKPNPDASSSLSVKCLVKNYQQRLKKVTVTIYKEGMIYTCFEAENRKIEVDLPIGSHYLLEFQSEMHFTKRIAVSTDMQESDSEIPKLDLTMTLIPITFNYLSDEDLDLLDFPVAYLAYDHNKKTYYDKNEVYSEVLLKHINQKSQEHMKNGRNL